MAMEALHPQKLNLALIYGTRKCARRSKPSQGITIKKLKKEYRDYNDDGTEPYFKKMRFCESSGWISGSASVDDQYESLNEISRGAYGVVHRARNKKTGEIVAIKKEFDGKCVTSLREIQILKNLHRHPSIVEFKKAVVDDRDGVYLVMEYLESDLGRYIKKSPRIEAKLLIKQLLEGVKFLHDNAVMHRDLKPSNILMKNVNGSHKLKICDFGLSRHFESREGSYTPLVVTLWYRAPELLLGAKRYSSAIDMWSVGCIMAELLLKEALFPGETEISQLAKIYGILGTPNVKDWPEFSSLPGSKCTLIKQPRNLLRYKIPAALLTEIGFDLLRKLLTYDPGKRITAEAALDHDIFERASLQQRSSWKKTSQFIYSCHKIGLRAPH